MKTAYYLLSLLFVFFDARAINHQWDPKLILSLDCALKQAWRESYPVIPNTVKDNALIANIQAQREKRDQVLYKAYSEAANRYEGAMAASNYSYSDGKVVRLVEPELKEDKEQATFALIQRVYKRIKKTPIKMDNGVKIIVCKKDEAFLVYFEVFTKPNTRGPSFHPLVIVDIKSGEISNLLSGS